MADSAIALLDCLRKLAPHLLRGYHLELNGSATLLQDAISNAKDKARSRALKVNSDATAAAQHTADGALRTGTEAGHSAFTAQLTANAAHSGAAAAMGAVSEVKLAMHQNFALLSEVSQPCSLAALLPCQDAWLPGRPVCVQACSTGAEQFPPAWSGLSKFAERLSAPACAPSPPTPCRR